MDTNKTEQVDTEERVKEVEAPAEPAPPPFAEGDEVEIQVDGLTVRGKVAAVDAQREVADVDFTHVVSRRFSRISRPFAVGDAVQIHKAGAALDGKIVKIDNGKADVRCTEVVSRAFSEMLRAPVAGDAVQIAADGAMVDGKVVAVQSGKETADVEFRRIGPRLFTAIQHLGT